MTKFKRYLRIILVISAAFTISYICVFLSRDIVHHHVERDKFSMWSELPNAMKKEHFSDKELDRMSVLGKWLLSPEETPPPLKRVGKKTYLILIWKHGPFLERRHIRRFGQRNFSPWEGCSVNCTLTYDSEDLTKADAVVFHLHQTKNIGELPARINFDQRWIFLTDESPMHTFMYNHQNLSEYNGIFNWSMSYRMDSDVPVPYGRTLLKSTFASPLVKESLKNDLKKLKSKLVAIMGSNCSPTSGRWKYASTLKRLLEYDFDVYGKCLNGNTTACPGHFDRDCPLLNSYKFYLAFENSKCREYLTEKVFWNSYEKFSVPVIMGAPKKDCIRLLPPNSFLHIKDFDDPIKLANYIRYLDRNDDAYFEYHQWRQYYRVVNEHGYFGSVSRHYCRICEALYYNSPEKKTYRELESFINKRKDCSSLTT